VDGIARDSLAKARAESGLTPTYFTDVGRALLKRFRQTQEDAEREQKLGEKVVEKARDVTSVFSRSGKMEDPLAQPRRVDPLASAASLHPVVEESMKNLAYSLPQDWTRSAGTVVVRLTQAGDGQVLSVELMGSSGNRGLDQAAVTAVQALGKELPPPPPDVLRGRDSVVSEWKFELLRTVAGPAAKGLGLVGTFDIGTDLPEARPTFAARSEVRVTLVAYY
jgi:TonB family protein